MKIVVVGTRGIPHIQGGIETRCEELYPRLVKLGYDVTVVRRSPYVSSLNKIPEYKGVKLHDIYVTKKKEYRSYFTYFLIYLLCKKGTC